MSRGNRRSARPRITLAEAFGVQPWRDAIAQARLALGGDAHTPRSRFDVTSLRNLHPLARVRTWLGFASRQALITNYFNHTQTPTSQGWSVRRTQVLDYRGDTLTYDSHNGTDFSVPVGSDVVAAAPGIVRRVSSEFHRGGKKVVIDHGNGLMTSSNHLARVVVVPGLDVHALAGGHLVEGAREVLVGEVVVGPLIPAGSGPLQPAHELASSSLVRLRSLPRPLTCSRSSSADAGKYLFRGRGVVCSVSVGVAAGRRR